MKFLKKHIPVFALFTIMMLSGSCKRTFRHDEGMVWHTTYHITYEAPSDLRDSILRVFQDVGASLNAFDPESLASLASRRDSVEVDSHFRRVHDMSLKINRLSEGVFDPTLGPLITAWGFGKGHRATRDTLRLDSLLAITGINRTRIENGLLLKEDARIEFNFSAIAKGYGCDRVAEMLMRNGVTNFMVEIGGEIRCGGKSPSGGRWRISVDRPLLADSVVHESQCILELAGGGLATSGNYRNYRREGGRVLGHTISPVTGRPVETDVLSASVVAPTAMEADALATALMALGSERAKRLVVDEGYGALLVLADSTVWTHNLPLAR